MPLAVYETDCATGGLWTTEDQPHYFLDWDSTLCQRETLDVVAELVLTEDELKKFESLTKQGMSGNIPFSESLAQRFAILRAHREQIEAADQALVDLIDPTAIERRQCIEENQDRIHIISGGFEELIMPSLSATWHKS